MNERFVELATLAGLQPFEDCGPGYVAKMENFAQLIVCECISVMEYEANEARQYFTYMGDDVPTSVLCNAVQNHFGIKE